MDAAADGYKDLKLKLDGLAVTRRLLRGKLEKRGFNVSEHEFLDATATGAPAGLHTTGVVAVDVLLLSG